MYILITEMMKYVIKPRGLKFLRSVILHGPLLAYIGF